MDYGRRELADRLAAEYVLGTLRGPARRRFTTLLAAHPALRDAVAQWQARLAPMADRVPPVAPPPAVWSRIESQLFDTARPLPWWRRLGAWQGVAGAATAAAIVLGVMVTQPPEAQPPIVVVLRADPQAPATVAAGFVASVSRDGGALVLRPLGDITLDPGRALELWAVPDTGAPRSLGLVRPDEATTVLRARLLQGTSAFAVSLEPEGGSPTGAPTGPIVSVGPVRL